MTFTVLHTYPCPLTIGYNLSLVALHLRKYFAYVVSLTYEVLTKPGSREVMLYVGFEPTLTLKPGVFGR